MLRGMYSTHIGFPSGLVVSIKDGYLNARFANFDVPILVASMMEKIRHTSRLETVTLTCLDRMARLARMVYELFRDQELKMLSKEDTDALLELDLNESTDFLFKAIHSFSSVINSSGLDDTAEGHMMAKNIRVIMES